MAQKIIDIGSAPDDGTGDPLRTAFDTCNDNFDELYTSDAGVTAEVQYVSENGSDAADGLTWANAVRTLDGAFANLPSEGGGNSAHKFGTIHIGPGQFETQGDLPLREGIHIYGSGTAVSDGLGGTWINLADDANTHMFDYGAFDDWSHDVLLQDIVLNGNKAGQSGVDQVSGINIGFTDDDPDTITRASGDFAADNYVAGDMIKVAGSASNDGYYEVASVATLALTLHANEVVTAAGATSGITVSRVNFDVLRLFQGGFQCRLRSVRIFKAGRYGIFIGDNAVNVNMYDMGIVQCEGGGIFVNHAGEAFLTIGIYGIQIDDCGIDAFKVYKTSFSTGIIGIYDFESEALTSARGHHQHVFAIEAVNGTVPIMFNIQNANCAGGSAAGTHDAICYEYASASAYPASWHCSNFRSVGGNKYPVCFDSADRTLTGLSLPAFGNSEFLHEFHSTDRAIQHGNVLFLTGAGTPESNQAAPPGSLYTNSSGGADTSLYIKETGTGDTGWSAMAGV